MISTLPLPLPPPTKPGRCLVRWRGYALRFHTNLCGKMYQVVADVEATRFDSFSAALTAATAHKVPLADMTLSACS
jgi:hypothetical protein